MSEPFQKSSPSRAGAQQVPQPEQQPQPLPEPSIGAWLLGAGAAAITGIAAAGGPVKAAETMGAAVRNLFSSIIMTPEERDRARREQEIVSARELENSEAARENARLEREARKIEKQRIVIEQREKLRLAEQAEVFNREKERQAALDLEIEQQKTREKEAALEVRALHAAPITSNDIEDDLSIVARNLGSLVFSPAAQTLGTAPSLKLKLNQIQLRGVAAKRERALDPFGAKSLEDNVFNYVPQKGDKKTVAELIDDLVLKRHDLREQAKRDYRENLERLFVDAFQYGYQTGEQPNHDYSSAAFKAGLR